MLGNPTNHTGLSAIRMDLSAIFDRILNPLVVQSYIVWDRLEILCQLKTK